MLENMSGTDAEVDAYIVKLKAWHDSEAYQELATKLNDIVINVGNKKLDLFTKDIKLLQAENARQSLTAEAAQSGAMPNVSLHIDTQG